jgi:DNA-directed RNA polymerase subunit RPC12/RpoP
MSQRRQIEQATGTGLLLGLVAQEAATRQCARCGGTLSNSRITLRAQDPQQAVVAVACRACGEEVLVRVEPDAGRGTARVR